MVLFIKFFLLTYSLTIVNFCFIKLVLIHFFTQIEFYAVKSRLCSCDVFTFEWIDGLSEKARMLSIFIIFGIQSNRENVFNNTKKMCSKNTVVFVSLSRVCVCVTHIFLNLYRVEWFHLWHFYSLIIHAHTQFICMASTKLI